MNDGNYGSVRYDVKLHYDMNLSSNQHLMFTVLLSQPLDYEDSPLKNVTISVENEIPYHTCEVVSRSTTGLWKVVRTSGATIGGTTGFGKSSRTYRVTVTVEDVNDPPIFDKPNEKVTLGENTEAGQTLVTFTARDPDIASANTFV